MSHLYLFDNVETLQTQYWPRFMSPYKWSHQATMSRLYDLSKNRLLLLALLKPGYMNTSTGIDADASKGETSPGYFNSKLVYSYRCGTIFPWEFPEISLAYSHIFMKGPSRSIIYGQIFWHPHPHPHIASPACIYHQNQLSFAFRFSFHLTIHFENAGNICNKIDL